MVEWMVVAKVVAAVVARLVLAAKEEVRGQGMVMAVS